MMNEIANRLENAAGVSFERDINGNAIIRPYSSIRDEQRVEGYYFRLDDPYYTFSNMQIDAILAEFPMQFAHVDYYFGNIAQPDSDGDRTWAASVAFYWK